VPALLLYTDPVSNYGARVEIALRFKGIPYRVEPPPGGYGSPEYRRIVPTGTIPAIVEDGFVLAESEVIVEYLEETRPEPPLLPRDPRERAFARWLARLHDVRVEPPLRALFPHMDPKLRDPDTVARQLDLFEARLRELAALGWFSPWLAGSGPGAADFAWPATLDLAAAMYAALGREWSPPPAIRLWHERVSAHPAAAPVLERAAAATRDWLRRKGAAGRAEGGAGSCRPGAGPGR
jgi:glutathione S-transferase